VVSTQSTTRYRRRIFFFFFFANDIARGGLYGDDGLRTDQVALNILLN
jgi:hypothetical protein